MAKNKIPKDALDEAIDLAKSYWAAYPWRRKSGLVGNLRFFCACLKIQIATHIFLYDIRDLLTAVIFGIKPDAINEDIYAILRLLGWEVSD